MGFASHEKLLPIDLIACFGMECPMQRLQYQQYVAGQIASVNSSRGAKGSDLLRDNDLLKPSSSVEQSGFVDYQRNRNLRNFVWILSPRLILHLIPQQSQDDFSERCHSFEKIRRWPKEASAPRMRHKPTAGDKPAPWHSFFGIIFPLKGVYTSSTCLFNRNGRSQKETVVSTGATVRL